MPGHLLHPEQAGLAQSRRDGRQIIDAVQIAAVANLIDFLLQDCCGGRRSLSPFLAAGAARSSPHLSPHPNRLHRPVVPHHHRWEHRRPNVFRPPHGLFNCRG